MSFVPAAGIAGHTKLSRFKKMHVLVASNMSDHGPTWQGNTCPETVAHWCFERSSVQEIRSYQTSKTGRNAAHCDLDFSPATMVITLQQEGH